MRIGDPLLHHHVGHVPDHPVLNCVQAVPSVRGGGTVARRPGGAAQPTRTPGCGLLRQVGAAFIPTYLQARRLAVSACFNHLSSARPLYLAGFSEIHQIVKPSPADISFFLEEFALT